MLIISWQRCIFFPYTLSRSKVLSEKHGLKSLSEPLKPFYLCTVLLCFAESSSPPVSLCITPSFLTPPSFPLSALSIDLSISRSRFFRSPNSFFPHFSRLSRMCAICEVQASSARSVGKHGKIAVSAWDNFVPGRRKTEEGSLAGDPSKVGWWKGEKNFDLDPRPTSDIGLEDSHDHVLLKVSVQIPMIEFGEYKRLIPPVVLAVFLVKPELGRGHVHELHLVRQIKREASRQMVRPLPALFRIADTWNYINIIPPRVHHYRTDLRLEM